jgi:Holliday junction resolvase RusA-like endonuclease
MARPRLVGKKIYQPDSCPELTAKIAAEVQQPPIERPVIVDVNIHFEGASANNVWPVSQTMGDLDNHTKSVFDSLVKSGVLSDDRFIIGGESTKIFSGDDYVWIFIYELADEVDCFRVGGIHS